MKRVMVVIAATAFASPLWAGGRTVTIASWGGSFQDAQSKALFEPAAAATGIEVVQEVYNGMSDVREQVTSGHVTLDIVASGSGSAARAAADGLLEPLDFNVIDVSNIIPMLYMDHCIGGDVFSTVFAYSENAYRDNHPKTWADFWNVEKFPGKRAYRGKVAGALEPALMADGVAPADVYKVLDSEEGIERAINKIRELKPHIGAFWTAGDLPVTLLKEDQVTMATGWNGRFYQAMQEGASMDYDYEQALLDYVCFAIPKGAPHKDAAMEFINEISKAEYQDDLPKYINYGPTNKRAYETGEITPEIAIRLPSWPDNASRQLPISADWYVKWEIYASKKYEEMLAE